MDFTTIAAGSSMFTVVRERAKSSHREVGNIDRIRSASQIVLAVLLPSQPSVGVRRVDVDLLVGVAQRSGARARTVVIPASCGLSPLVVPAPRARASSIGRMTWILSALVLAAIAMLGFAVTRALL